MPLGSHQPRPTPRKVDVLATSFNERWGDVPSFTHHGCINNATIGEEKLELFCISASLVS